MNKSLSQKKLEPVQPIDEKPGTLPKRIQEPALPEPPAFSTKAIEDRDQRGFPRSW